MFLTFSVTENIQSYNKYFFVIILKIKLKKTIKMKKAIFISIILLSYFAVFSQNDPTIYDPQAKEVLDNLADKLEGKNARLYFLYSFYNAQDSSSTDYYGYLFAKDDDKYKVMVPNVEVFSDGVKTYSYNKKNNEMNITFVDPSNDLAYTPQKLITIYKTGYKYSYRGEVTFDAKVKVNGQVTTKSKNCHVVDLYPENPKKSNFSIIRIWIDKDANELVSVKFQYNSGIEEVVEILNFEIDVNINDDIFIFDPSKYPSDLDVIDFTED